MADLRDLDSWSAYKAKKDEHKKAVGAHGVMSQQARQAAVDAKPEIYALLRELEEKHRLQIG